MPISPMPSVPKNKATDLLIIILMRMLNICTNPNRNVDFKICLYEVFDSSI